MTRFIFIKSGHVPRQIDNRERFLEAAARILRKLAKFADPKMTEKELQKRETALKKDLDKCMGAPLPRYFAVFAPSRSKKEEL